MQKKRALKKEETTRKIVEAASKIFADTGFEGARVDEIAKAAGVNKATIYYNIGDKEALYNEVIYSVVGTNADKIISNIEMLKTPEEKLILFIETFIGGMSNNPFLPRILMREHAGGGRNFPDRVIEDFRKIVHVLIEILDEGKEEGVFREINPLIFHMHLIGGISFYQATIPVREKHKVFKNYGNYSTEELKKMITDFVLASVKKQG